MVINGINGKSIEKYFPFSERTCNILLALAEPLHGYGVMQKVEAISGGDVKIGPGTLYGAFSKLEEARMIRMVNEEDRRKSYQLTEKGEAVLLAQLRRLEVMAANGARVKEALST